jgi:hypothetical protein
LRKSSDSKGPFLHVEVVVGGWCRAKDHLQAPAKEGVWRRQCKPSTPMPTPHLRRLQRAEIDAYALALLRGGVTRGRVIDGMPDWGSLQLIILGLFPSSLRMVNDFVGRPRGPRCCIMGQNERLVNHSAVIKVCVPQSDHSAEPGFCRWRPLNITQ